MLQTKDKRFLKQLRPKSQKFLVTAKVGFAHYDSFRGGGSQFSGFSQQSKAKVKVI